MDGGWFSVPREEFSFGVIVAVKSTKHYTESALLHSLVEPSAVANDDENQPRPTQPLWEVERGRNQWRKLRELERRQKG